MFRSLLLLIISLIIISFTSYGQCDLVFTTQSQIDAFNCNEAVASITIQDNNDGIDNITNLFGFYFAGTNVSVTGDLIIRYCNSLTSLDGLDRILSVGGDFRVYENPELTEINAPVYPFLMTSIGGLLEIKSNYKLTSHADFNELTSVGEIDYSYNSDLTLIGGFASLTTISADVVIFNNIDLSAVTAFPQVSIVLGSIYVTSNISLSNCCFSIYDLYVASGFEGGDISGNATGCNSVSEIDDPLSYTFSTQSDVDNFRPCSFGVVDLNFFGSGSTDDPITALNPIYIHGGPDLVVTGDILVQNNTALTTCDGLDRILSVGGTFAVQGCPELTDIALEAYPFALSSVGGQFVISNNASLSSINYLNSLASVGSDFILSNNESLTGIGGFNALTMVDGYYAIGENPMLADIDGFGELTSVGSFFSIDNNNSLTNVSGFPSLNIGDNQLGVHENPLLSACCWLQPILETATGPVFIEFNAPGCNSQAETASPQNYLLQTQTDVDNFQATDCGVGDLIIDGTGITEDAISSLVPIFSQSGTGLEVQGKLFIKNCSALATLDGLDRISTVGGSLIIDNNPILTSIHHPSWAFQLTSVGGILQIQNNPMLGNIDDFNALESIGGRLDILYNDALSQINGFSALESISDILRINNNMSLTNMGSYPLLTSVSGIVIRNNAELPSIPNFNAVTSTFREFEVSNNPSLISIDGFNGVTSWDSPDHGLHIYDNASLTNISCFPSLLNIETDPGHEEAFRITNNPSLNTVDAFQSLNTVDGDVNVSDNSMLSTCCWLAPILDVAFGGTITVQNNAEGCNSIEEVNGPQNYLLTNQTEVNAFSLCPNGIGDLIIDGSTEGDDPIINLNPIFFASLTDLSGDLIVRNCSELLTLEGLDGIINVGGDFQIQANTTLTEINSAGFPFQMSSVGGDLSLYSNHALQIHADLNQLSSVGGNLIYEGNDNLTNIGGYSNLTSVKGFYIIFHTELLQLPEFTTLNSSEAITIIFNDVLQVIPHFDGLTTGLDDIDIGFNNAITTIDGFNNLTEITGNRRLKIGQCPNLQSITGFNSLQSITGYGDEPVFEIKSNNNLVTVSGFQNLTEVTATVAGGTAIDVSYNTSLSACCWLEPVIAGAVGIIIVENNATGCSSEAEIEAQECPEPIDCPSDFNGDLVVDISDFLLFNSSFGPEPCIGCQADLNDDGFVTVSDFILFNSAFGPCLVLSPPTAPVGNLNPSLAEAIDKQEATTIHPELHKFMNDMQTHIEFSIVPNPNNGRAFELFLVNKRDEFGPGQLDILDMTGRIVHSKQMTSGGGTRLEVLTDQNMSPGMYIITLTQNGRTASERMSVE